MANASSENKVIMEAGILIVNDSEGPESYQSMKGLMLSFSKSLNNGKLGKEQFGILKASFTFQTLILVLIKVGN